MIDPCTCGPPAEEVQNSPKRTMIFDRAVIRNANHPRNAPYSPSGAYIARALIPLRQNHSVRNDRWPREPVLGAKAGFLQARGQTHNGHTPSGKSERAWRNTPRIGRSVGRQAVAQQDNGTWQSVRNGKEGVDAPYLRAVDYDNIGSQMHEVTAVAVDFTVHSSYQVPGAMETFGPRDFLAGSNSRWGTDVTTLTSCPAASHSRTNDVATFPTPVLSGWNEWETDRVFIDDAAPSRGAATARLRPP